MEHQKTDYTETDETQRREGRGRKEESTEGKGYGEKTEKTETLARVGNVIQQVLMADIHTKQTKSYITSKLLRLK